MKVLSSLPVFLLRDELPLNKGRFFLMESVKKNRNEAIFGGKIEMNDSMIIYQVSKTKTKAKLG